MTEKRKYRLLVGLIVLSVLPVPFTAQLSSSIFFDIPSFMLYTSSVLGYFGILLLMWMYILGTKSVIGLYFRDMPEVLKLHSLLGKYGVLFIFAHPLAASLAYGQNVLLYSIVPDLSSTYEVYVTYGRFAIYGLLLIWLTSAIARGSIAYRPWKYIHYVSYIILPLALLHIPTVGSSFGEKGAKFYFFGVLGIWVIFSLLRLRHLFMLGKSRFVIASHAAATDDIMYLQLTAYNQSRMSNTKGQYLYLQMNLLGEEHPFSVLQYDPAGGTIAIAYKKSGRFTHALSQLSIGSTVFIDGPYGTFTHELKQSPNLPSVFIAGGIGITPFVDHILTHTSNQQWLFYANQSQSSSAFAETLKSKLGDHFVPIFSNDERADGEHGYVRPDLFTKYLSDPSYFHYFICGPARMMELTKESLISVGVSATHIHSEEFSF